MNPLSKKLKLTLLPDGDIEIRDEEGKRVYHKSFDPGDSIRKNLIDAYDFMRAYEDPNFDREAYFEEQRKKQRWQVLENFDRCLSKLVNDQKDKTKPIYVIAKWWCGQFAGIEKYTTHGDKDLPDLKKEFDEKYAWHPGDFGITEQGYTIVKIEAQSIINHRGVPNCAACAHCDACHQCELTGIDAKDPCERFLLRGITSNQSNSQSKKEA